MLIIAPTDIPEMVTIDGKIEITEARFLCVQTSQDFTEGFKIELDIEITSNLNGFEIEPWTSKLRHSLSDSDFVKFMENLRKLTTDA